MSAPLARVRPAARRPMSGSDHVHLSIPVRCAIPQECAEAQSPRAPHGAPPMAYHPFELLLRFPRRALADRQLLRNCEDARRLGTDGTMIHVLAIPCPCLQERNGRNCGIA